MPRVEAAVVDGIVRGEDFGSLSSRAAALDWDPTADTLAVAGTAPAGDRADAVAAVAEWAASIGRAAMSGVHGDRLVVILAGSEPPGSDVEKLFGDGPVVHGRPGAGLREAAGSAADALAGLDAVGSLAGGPANRRRRRPARRTGDQRGPTGCRPIAGRRCTRRWRPHRRRC